MFYKHFVEYQVAQIHVMLVQHREEFLSLDVDVAEDIVVDMDKSLTKVIDEDQLNGILNLDEVV